MTEVTTPTAQPTSSPVNAQSASSKANQQAAAAGETQGLTNQDSTVTDEGSALAPAAPPQTPTEIKPEPATLEPAPRFEKTGNKHIDQVADLLSTSKIENINEILEEVLTKNELTLTSKAQIVEEYGADVANIIINQLESSVSSMKTELAEEGKRLKEYAFSKFGGDNPEMTWEGLQKYAQEEAGLTPQEKKVMNKMLANGGIEGQMVIDSLHAKYQQSSGYNNPPNLLQGDSAMQSGFQPMTKKEYQEQIGPAVVKYGESSQEVQALRNRRAISMSRGIA